MAINKTLSAINDSPEGSSLSPEAMAAAAELAAALQSVKPVLASASAAQSEGIVAGYVGDVVVPSYRTLAAGASTLADAARALAADPSDSTFAAFTAVWHQARLGMALTSAFSF